LKELVEKRNTKYFKLTAENLIRLEDEKKIVKRCIAKVRSAIAQVEKESED